MLLVGSQHVGGHWIAIILLTASHFKEGVVRDMLSFTSTRFTAITASNKRVVWAIGNCVNFKWPEVLVFIQNWNLDDLNWVLDTNITRIPVSCILKELPWIPNTPGGKVYIQLCYLPSGQVSFKMFLPLPISVLPVFRISPEIRI